MNDLAAIEAQLTRVLEFFPRVDTKVAGLFTIDAAILTVSALNVEAGDLRHWYIAVPGIFVVIGLVASLAFLYQCNFPQLDGGQGSLVYFGEIRKRTEANYLSEFEAVSEATYRRDLLGQVWRNSVILCDKYIAIARAIRCTLATLLPFSIFLIMTAIEHSRVPVLGA